MDGMNEEKEIERGVMDAIRSGRISMRPRWRFVVLGLAYAAATLAMLMLALALASFIVFSLRQTGALSAAALGPRGILIFFRSLPWMLLTIFFALLLTLERMMRRWQFAYLTPAAAIALTTLLAVIAVGWETAPFHKRPFRRARHGGIPLAGALYRGYGMRHFDGLHRGSVVATTSGGFLLEEGDGATSTVFVAAGTRMPNRTLSAGDVVVIVSGRGDATGTIRAFGIRLTGDAGL